MQASFTEFRKFLLVKKGIMDITIRGYTASLKPAFKRIGSVRPSHQQIVDYITWMHEQKYSYSYIVNTSLALEWWTLFKGYPVKLGRPRKPNTIVKDTLTEAEVTRLISASKNIKEKAISSLLAYSGIRNKELCGLRVCDIDLGDNMVRVLEGKGRKDRLIHISGDCSKVISEYLIRFEKENDEYLFMTYQGNQYTGFALRKLVRVLADRAGIKKRVYPHLLRHSLATNLLRRGCNLILIQRQLGHVFIESTMIYIRSFPQRIQNEYNIYIPSYL